MIPKLSKSFTRKLVALLYALVGACLCIWTFASLQIILTSTKPVELQTTPNATATKREAALAAPLILLKELHIPGRWILPQLNAELVIAAEPADIEKITRTIQQDAIEKEINWLEGNVQVTDMLSGLSGIATSNVSEEDDLIKREIDLSKFVSGMRFWLLERKRREQSPLLAIYGQWLSANETQYFALRPRLERSVQYNKASAEPFTLINTVVMNRVSDSDSVKMQFGKSNQSGAEVQTWLDLHAWELHENNDRALAATKEGQIIYAFPCSGGGSWLIWIEYA